MPGIWGQNNAVTSRKNSRNLHRSFLSLRLKTKLCMPRMRLLEAKYQELLTEQHELTQGWKIFKFQTVERTYYLGLSLQMPEEPERLALN